MFCRQGINSDHGCRPRDRRLAPSCARWPPAPVLAAPKPAKLAPLYSGANTPRPSRHLFVVLMAPQRPKKASIRSSSVRSGREQSLAFLVVMSKFWPMRAAA
jgi:hypothetical protein